MHEKWYCIQFHCIWHSKYTKCLLTRWCDMVKTQRKWLENLSCAISIIFVGQYIAFLVVRFFFKQILLLFFLQFLCHSIFWASFCVQNFIFLYAYFTENFHWCWWELPGCSIAHLLWSNSSIYIYIFFFFQVLHLLRINILMNQIFAQLLLKQFAVRNCKQQQQL